MCQINHFDFYIMYNISFSNFICILEAVGELLASEIGKQVGVTDFDDFLFLDTL